MISSNIQYFNSLKVVIKSVLLFELVKSSSIFKNDKKLDCPELTHLIKTKTISPDWRFDNMSGKIKWDKHDLIEVSWVILPCNGQSRTVDRQKNGGEFKKKETSERKSILSQPRRLLELRVQSCPTAKRLSLYWGQQIQVFVIV